MVWEDNFEVQEADRNGILIDSTLGGNAWNSQN
jgi:hypothetical protein